VGDVRSRGGKMATPPPPRRRDEDAEDWGDDEEVDTLSELYITGARARGDGGVGVMGGGGRPIWLQGRDRKLGGLVAAGPVGGAGRGNAGLLSVVGREAERQPSDADAFQTGGSSRRRGPPGLSSIQSTLHDDLPSPKPKMTTSEPSGMGGTLGRGRRAQGGAMVGGITGSAIRSAHHDPVRESLDSLTLFARGHAGRLAPSMAAKKGSPARRLAAHGAAPGSDADACLGGEDLASGVPGLRRGGQGIRESGLNTLNRLGSAPVEGRGDGESAYPALAANRQVISAHGSKNPSIRLDMQPFCIPVLPTGRHVRLDIITTWGDAHYVGLSGIELFDERGAVMHVNAADISADPADINILPGYYYYYYYYSYVYSYSYLYVYYRPYTIYTTNTAAAPPPNQH
jgi:hypothetical protein